MNDFTVLIKTIVADMRDINTIAKKYYGNFGLRPMKGFFLTQTPLGHQTSWTLKVTRVVILS